MTGHDDKAGDAALNTAHAGHRTGALVDALQDGRPLNAQARALLDSCPLCRAEWAALTQVQRALLEDAAAPQVAPPPALRAELLSRAREVEARRLDAQDSVMQAPPLQALATQAPGAGVRQPRPARARLPRLALGAAAAVAVLTAAALLFTPPSFAYALPDPAVVVNTGSGLLVASNSPQVGGQAQLSVVTHDRVSATLGVASPHPAWFTEGVRLNEVVYLADAGNDRILEVQARPLRLRRAYKVSGGVAGLSAGGGRVYFKSVRGEVGVLPGAQDAGRTVRVAQDAGVPMTDVMDAVLLQGGTLYVTHHLRGELCLLDPGTLAVRRVLRLGGAPVALAGLSGDLLVLDLKGRVLRLNAAGQVLHSWAVPGQPDKLVLNGERAVLSDRSGRVSELDLYTGHLRSVHLSHPMDVQAVGDGTVMVAEGHTGVTVLGRDLKPMPGGILR